MPEPRVNWRSTPRALRSAVQPTWSFPRSTVDHVAEQARLAGVSPSRWARIALELADPATVAARLSEQDAEPAGSKGAARETRSLVADAVDDLVPFA